MRGFGDHVTIYMDGSNRDFKVSCAMVTDTILLNCFISRIPFPFPVQKFMPYFLLLSMCCNLMGGGRICLPFVKKAFAPATFPPRHCSIGQCNMSSGVVLLFDTWLLRGRWTLAYSCWKWLGGHYSQPWLLCASLVPDDWFLILYRSDACGYTVTRALISLWTNLQLTRFKVSFNPACLTMVRSLGQAVLAAFSFRVSLTVWMPFPSRTTVPACTALCQPGIYVITSHSSLLW